MVGKESWWAVAVDKVDGSPITWDGFESMAEAELFNAEELDGQGVIMTRQQLIDVLPWWSV